MLTFLVVTLCSSAVICAPRNGSEQSQLGMLRCNLIFDLDNYKFYMSFDLKQQIEFRLNSNT